MSGFFDQAFSVEAFSPSAFAFGDVVEPPPPPTPQSYYGGGREWSETDVQKWWEREEERLKKAARAVQEAEPLTNRERVAEPEREPALESEPFKLRPPTASEFSQAMQSAIVALEIDGQPAPTDALDDTLEEDLMMALAIAEADDWP